ncbi:MAG: hypothetical protein F6K16_09840 [Symploca sp. SIO2B6]|nr:hypothetical protein [Symploca sp. SIO2B6]
MTINIIVLVSGTVDPLCLNSSTKVRAHSYSCDGNYYWNSQVTLIDRLKKLCNEYEQLAFFDQHGWSGDNAKINRKIAGEFLANRLCGSGGENAYYVGYRNKNVSFHLIGHSHGGNVINEFTRRAAEAEEWPEQWKIRSITYLSTPFFNKKHQLCTGALAPDCKIINVFNHFDLTQRIIADFSMYDLVSAINRVNEDHPDFVKTIEKIKQTPFQDEIDKLTSVFDNFNPFKLVFKPAAYKLSESDGKNVYTKTLQLLELVRRVLCEAKNIVEQLSTLQYYSSNKDVRRRDNSEKSSHYFISNDLRNKMNQMLDALLRDIEAISTAVDKRQDKNDYKLIPLISDICPVLNRVIDAFTIDLKTAQGPIIDLFCALLENQIEEFDITSATPQPQLPQSFQSQLFNINISDQDPYCLQGDLKKFEDFIKQLEVAENDYERCSTQRNLLSMGIKLLAPQIELQTIRAILKKGIQFLDTPLGKRKFGIRRIGVKLFTLLSKIKPLFEVACRLQTLLKSYDELLDEFSIKLLDSEQQTSVKHSENEPIIGSLKHFCLVSHSISRKCLYPQVEELLISQFDTPKVKSVKPMI